MEIKNFFKIIFKYFFLLANHVLMVFWVCLVFISPVAANANANANALLWFPFLF